MSFDISKQEKIESNLRAGLLIASVCSIAGLLTFQILFARQSGDMSFEREITLKEKTQVKDQKVCLDDLVEEGWIKSRCAVDRNNCCRWSLNGKILREISKREVQKELGNINFGGVYLSLKGGTSVQVTQTHRILNESEVSKAVERTLNKPNSAIENLNGIETKVLNVRFVSPIYIELASESDWSIELVGDIAGVAQQGFSAKIVSTKDKKLYGWIQVRAEYSADTYVARRNLSPGAEINKEDFEVRKIALKPDAVSGWFKKDYFPVGFKTRVSLNKGDILHSGAIARIPAVKLGDIVTLILKSESLQVSTKGIVQGTAGVGDMVTVALPRYRRSFRGKVLEGKRVEVKL